MACPPYIAVVPQKGFNTRPCLSVLACAIVSAYLYIHGPVRTVWKRQPRRAVFA